MERTLLMLRHGKSLHGLEYGSDYDRPLSPRGEKAARRMGRLLKERGLIPDLIIASPANRALSTARLVQAEVGDVELVEDEGLYTASVDDIYELLQRQDDAHACLLIVGHNFVFEEFADDVSGREDVTIKTCSLAVLHCDIDSWSELTSNRAKLADLVHPRDLPD